MDINDDSKCTISYHSDLIVLSGDKQAIHNEADKILRRFAHSARPYQVQEDTADRVVLATRR